MSSEPETAAAERDFDPLLLENQLCFPLYACSRMVVKKYHPFLEELDLTYTQYIAMMVVWEAGRISAKTMGERLFLDSGTLTPVLKSLEAKGFVSRCRSSEDERVLMVELTEAGRALRERAESVPSQMAGCLTLDPADAAELYRILYKLLKSE